MASLETTSLDILTLPPPGADRRVAYGAEPSQFGELRLPAGPGPHPVVVYLHGGFWRAAYSLAHAGHVCAALAKAGLATWSLEYRRIGEPGGAWPGTFQDVGRGADALRELAEQHPLDLGRVLAMGHSAGGQLALWVAGRPRIPADSPVHRPDPLRVHAAVSLAGVCDLRRGAQLALSEGVVEDLLGGSPDQAPERYAAVSPIELLPLGVPQVLVHGTADDRVPHELSQRYQAAAAPAGDRVELVSLPGTGHFELIDPRTSAWPAVLTAARRLLAALPAEERRASA